MINIRPENIVFIEAMENYSLLVLPEQRITLHHSLKNLEAILEPHGFVRIHRSYIVFPPNIEKINDAGLHIQGKLVPIGKSYRKNLKKHITVI